VLFVCLFDWNTKRSTSCGQLVSTNSDEIVAGAGEKVSLFGANDGVKPYWAVGLGSCHSIGENPPAALVTQAHVGLVDDGYIPNSF
jgi:hypothetical protein